MDRAEKLRDIRQLLGTTVSSGKEFWKAPNFPHGVARGIVVELLGSGRTEWLLQLFAQYPEHYILWCEREIAVNPLAIHQRGVGLERIKFLNSTGDLQQPLRLALESQFYPFIIAPNRFDDIKAFHRFHLLCEKSKSTLFLFAEKKFSQAWPISLQLTVTQTDNNFEIDVQRQKHGLSV